MSYLKLYRFDANIHFFIYFILGVSLVKNIDFKKKIKTPLILIIIFLLPFFTEYFQQFRPRRAADIFDLYYDYAGLLVGIIAILTYRYVRKIKN